MQFTLAKNDSILTVLESLLKKCERFFISKTMEDTRHTKAAKLIQSTLAKKWLYLDNGTLSIEK